MSDENPADGSVKGFEPGLRLARRTRRFDRIEDLERAADGAGRRVDDECEEDVR
jgi:hypothetical protein